MKNRRQFLQATGVLGLGMLSGLTSACTSSAYLERHLWNANQFRKFPKLAIAPDLVVKETVGLRPYRKTGFRIEAETLGNKTIVHNYGHGGSGWSLSWGTARMAVALASATGVTDFAVMGGGVIGLTTARMLQLQGYTVTMYTKALPPQVTSSKATGTWSPGYTLIQEDHITPAFLSTWSEATHYSFETFQNLLGLNNIVQWVDQYRLMSEGPAKPHPGHSDQLYLSGLLPAPKELSRKEHPFRADKVMHERSLIFNIPSYLEKHMRDFLAFGGKVVIRNFNTLEDIDALPQSCVMNCTGLGAKKLFGDEDLLPVAGQLSFLLPQPAFNYRIITDHAYAIPRRDGVVLGGNAIVGSWDETPSYEQTQKVVHHLMEVMNYLRA